MPYPFQKNDHVIYGKTGLCMIQDIKPLTFSNMKENIYYILQPVHDKNETVFVPCNSPNLISKMRRTMTKDEIDAVLSEARGKTMEWIDDKNARSDYFHQIIANGSQTDMLLVVSCIYQNKKHRESCGKKLCSSDEHILQSLEKLIEDEFAFSLRLNGEQVGEYIRDRLEIHNEESQ